ncbi:RNA-directed DNA polymerase, eukaryota, reverse transcriptase zinc-binding domain protein [Tanacetum coccineum]
MWYLMLVIASLTRNRTCLSPLRLFNMVVKLATWNVKGMCNTLKQNEVKTFINSKNISLCGVIETQLRKKFVDKVCNDVFGVWEWVSNTTDSCKGCRIAVGWDPFVISASLLAQSDQVMHLSVRSLVDDKLMYVSVIYGEISPESRTKLWRNLCDHMSIVGNEPWVLLGDFNVIIKSNENLMG